MAGAPELDATKRRLCLALAAVAVVLAALGAADAAAAATIPYQPADFSAAIAVTEGGSTYSGTEYRDSTNKRVRRDVELPDSEVVSTFTFFDKGKAYTHDSLFNTCSLREFAAGGTAADVADSAGVPISDFVREGTLESEGQTLERWVGSDAEGPVVVGTGPARGNPSNPPTPLMIETSGSTIRYVEPFFPGSPDASEFSLPVNCGGAVEPTATIVTPGPGADYRLGQAVDAEFACGAGEQPLKPGAEGCAGTVPDGAPLDTSTPGPHAFTVTATDEGGASWTATRHYTVAAPPLARIAAPVPGAAFDLHEVVTAGYSCEAGAAGAAVQSCVGSVADGAPLDTSTPGTHTFTVVATAADGQTGTASVTYVVNPAPPAPAPPAPAPPSPPSAVRLTYTPNFPHAPNRAGGPRYTFHFSGDAGVVFHCKLDKEPFKPCTSPKVYRHLSRGRHVFAVKAVGPTGLESPLRRVEFVAGRRRQG